MINMIMNQRHPVRKWVIITFKQLNIQTNMVLIWNDLNPLKITMIKMSRNLENTSR